MHAGKAYRLSEFLLWTRRTIFWLLPVGILPVVLYRLAGWKWIAIPWTVVALLGTATAFIVGFKNTQTYSRTWEARQIWGSILNGSRAWGLLCRDLIRDRHTTRLLIYRHFAWLTALRYQLRESRAWESMGKAYNAEYQQRHFTIPEKEVPLEKALAAYLPEAELVLILQAKNKATQIMALQSATLRDHADSGALDSYQTIEFQRAMKDFYDQQGKAERIKNFPYPRQFATINSFFIRLFCLLLPLGLLKEFDRLNDDITGWMSGQMVWLAIPFSVLISWVYTSLEQVGESTENPFEGSANDVPITQMSRTIEIDLRQMLGETDLPPAIVPKDNIVL